MGSDPVYLYHYGKFQTYCALYAGGRREFLDEVLKNIEKLER